MATLPKSAAQRLEQIYKMRPHSESLTSLIPPKPLALADAYRRRNGLSSLTHVPDPKQASGGFERLTPYPEPQVRAGAIQAVRTYADAFADNFLLDRFTKTTNANPPRLPRRGLWGMQAMEVALNAVADRWAAFPQTDTAPYRQVVGALHLVRPRGLRGALEYCSPKDLWPFSSADRPSWHWAEHMQFATFLMLSNPQHTMYETHCYTVIDAYCKAMVHQHFYRNDRGHFGRVSYNLLGDILRILALRGARQIRKTEENSGPVDVVRYQAGVRTLPYDHPMDILALRCNPFTPPESMNTSALFAALDGHVRLPDDRTAAAEYLAPRHHRGLASQLALKGSSAPRLTVGMSEEVQGIERFVDIGSYALRSCDGTPDRIRTIASNLYHLLSVEDVYAHLGFFHGTRIAMGMLADAQTWDGGVPQFTQPMGGFGAILREVASHGGNADHAMALRTYLDPLRMFSAEQYERIFGRAHAYVHKAAVAGYFTEATAQNMQHSVQIGGANHRANAIVVHKSEGES